MITVVLQLLAFLYGVLLPGIALSLLARRSWDPPMRVAGGLFLGLLVIPMASFCAAWVLGTHIQPGLVLAVATPFNALGGFLLWRESRF